MNLKADRRELMKYTSLAEEAGYSWLLSICSKDKVMNIKKCFFLPSFVLTLSLFFLSGFVAGQAFAQSDGSKLEAAAQSDGSDANLIIKTLPEPDRIGGKPLMQALAERHSTRSFTDEAISDQDLSNLLWAAWGVNRSDGRHTAPTAKNKQEVAIYVALADGVWKYDPAKQIIVRYLSKDIRGALGGAPLILIYTAPAEDESAKFHIGSLYQNAGLYCASAGLGGVVKVTGADEADRILALKDGYKAMIIQAVGHSKE